MKLVASIAIPKFLKGISGSDISNLFVAINEVHTLKESRAIKVKDLTFLNIDPSYNIADATLLLHEVSTPDPSSGYKKIRLKVSVDATAQYPSPEGEVVNGHIQIKETFIDLDFENEAVIKQLINSTNIATTITKLVSSHAYQQLPGWQSVKKWMGYNTQTEPTRSFASMFIPTCFTMHHADIQTELTNTEHPEKKATFTVTAEKASYNLNETPRYLTGQNVKIALKGNQCAQLMPFNFIHIH